MKRVLTRGQEEGTIRRKERGQFYSPYLTNQMAASSEQGGVDLSQFVVAI